MISEDFTTMCVAVAHQAFRGSPSTTVVDIGDDDPSLRPLLVDSDSDYEAQSDYFGLPSNPVSVYHTGPPWKRPTGPEAQRVPKEARPICKHPIADVWAN
ncbi:hypothetical protein K439DRAFT_1626699 [Ramaria rubella]|nr:hypothetical protein K439DRAFT_1626699 [Ramaria rubella]